MSEHFTDEEMKMLTRQVIEYLDGWSLSAEQTIAILGADVKNRHLPLYRKGEKVLSQTKETIQRIEHIVGIADALRTAYPFSDQMRVLWLQKPHRRFRRKTPLSVILNEGLNGLMRVRVEIDCAYGWTINDAMQANAAANNNS
ncbi:MAG: Unknown protein [uncultured Thiotrichaceae bacterium]|uniref:DUF2384 domain-containing protein n=1 Tax=uncultured Thiotrichaceae bacterium TaxID=298394 RepID=A0A6S6S3F5_9GAMM|nr:MAG: Unknown protein [uncultured Thiotrichaceae bacterium]